MLIRLLCLAVLLLATLQLTSAAHAATPNSVVINADGTMTVDGAPYKIKGIAYSLVPVGESERSGVMGDYFTPDFAYMWIRDFPRLKAIGINTLRIYSWNPAVDHTAFLDTCHQYGMKVLLTHTLGYARDNHVVTADQRQAIIDKFVDEVKLIGDHPAILAWSFGNELNGWWLGFLDDFNTAYQCNWNSHQSEAWDNWGCVNLNNHLDNPNLAACQAARDCLYPKFFGWLDEAIRQAKQYSTRPMTATFADIDNIIEAHPTIDLIPKYGQYMTHFDFYAFQLYRGKTLQDYFKQYSAETTKPLVVSEFGVDAMNDPCGWPENWDSMRPCSVWHPGRDGQPGGADIPADPSTYVGCVDTTLACHVPGVTAQAQWDSGLFGEILNSYALGGFIFEWQDEFWKNVETQDSCAVPCNFWNLDACSDPNNPQNAAYQQGGSAGCTYKAHLSCGNSDSTIQDLCGYFLWNGPDNYVNEAWFGLNGINDCGDKLGSGANANHHLTTHVPRPVISALAQTLGGANNVPVPTCDQLRPCWQCTTSNTQADILSGKCNQACGLDYSAPVVTPPVVTPPVVTPPVVTPPVTTVSSTGASDPTTTTPGSPDTGSTGPVKDDSGTPGTISTKGAASELAPSAIVLLLLSVAALLL